jgi:hypothetical protein
VAVGDDAVNAGFAIVAPSDEVEQGYVEINRTRDYVAQVLSLIFAVWPTSKGGTGASDIAAAKVNLGINFGTDPPDDTNGGAIDGNIYLRIPGP